MRDIQRCVVCEGVEMERLHPATFDGGWEEAVSYFLTNRVRAVNGPISRCRKCGFVFTALQFEPEEYDRIYRRITDAVDDTKMAADRIRFERLLDIVSRVCPSGRFVDVGGADGQFVRLARKRGYSGSTIEPRAPSADEKAEKSTGLDFLTAWDVIEHLPELDQAMTHFHRMIRDGGHLFFTIPDIGSIPARLFGRKWNCILLEHLWYFNRETIRIYGERFGFRLQHVQSFPFAADIATIINRLSQTLGTPIIPLPHFIRRQVVTLPTGLILGVFRKI